MELRKHCPFCDKPKHLYCNTDKGVYFCHKCGAKGKIEHLPNADEIFSVSVTQHTSSPKRQELDTNQLRLIDRLNHPRFYKYAKSRNALKFISNLFYHPSYPQYLIIGLPLHTVFPNFFFGRKVIGGGPRYRYFQSTAGVIAKSYDEDDTPEHALIVEGFFDMCNTSEHIPTIANMGKMVSEEKADRIVEVVRKRVIIAFDTDALPESIILSGMLVNRGLGVRILHSTVFKDPGDSLDWIL